MIKCGNKVIEPTIFPDGTSQVWMDRVDHDDPEVWWFFESEAEFMHLAQFAYLRRIIGSPLTTLYVPFLPYARQHHDIDGTFALDPFLNLMDNLGFAFIASLDCHLEIGCTPYVNRVADPFIKQAIAASYADVILYPDAGAAGRYGTFGMPTTFCIKERDPQTGKITDFRLSPGVGKQLENMRVLIVDDIIDGGATFISAANVAYGWGACAVEGYATHGIFSKGTTPLRAAGINHFYTTDSFACAPHALGWLTVLDCSDLMKGCDGLSVRTNRSAA